MAHPRHQLDDAFMTPVRLSLMAALGPEHELDFATIRDLLEADDSAVSKAVAYLERAGYVRVTKGYVGSRPRTWVAATSRGYQAYLSHLVALRAITAGAMPGDDPAETAR